MSSELKKEMLNEIDNDVNKSLEFQAESEQEATVLSFINDDQKADDVLYWHKHYTDKIEELEKFRNNEIQRVELFVDNKIEYIKKRLSFLQNALESYLFANGHKSTTLINGRYGTRKNPDRVVILNKEEYIKYCEEHNLLNHLCNIQYQPKAKELKEHIQATGETPEGSEYITGHQKFYVKTYE